MRPHCCRSSRRRAPQKKQEMVGPPARDERALGCWKGRGEIVTRSLGARSDAAKGLDLEASFLLVSAWPGGSGWGVAARATPSIGGWPSSDRSPSPLPRSARDLSPSCSAASRVFGRLGSDRTQLVGRGSWTANVPVLTGGHAARRLCV